MKKLLFSRLISLDMIKEPDLIRPCVIGSQTEKNVYADLTELSIEDIVRGLPFPQMSFEIEGGAAISSLICGENGSNETIELLNQCIVCLSGLGREPCIVTLGITLPQKIPFVSFVTEYGVTTHMLQAGDNGGVEGVYVKKLKWMHDSDDEDFRSLAKDYSQVVLTSVRYLTNELTQKKTGLYNVPGKVKYKNPRGIRKEYRAKDVIYVSDVSRKSKSTPVVQGRKINWDHSWDVCAHWRKLHNPESLGLDQDGNRVVKGFTYIKSHVKGEGELKIKTRIVKRKAA